MPRINLQVVGIIEIDPRRGSSPAEVEASGLWQDLVRLAAPPRHEQAREFECSRLGEAASRWAAAPGANLTLMADLPGLQRDLDGEARVLLSRTCAARD